MKIKAKRGYNVVIKDLDITLSSDTTWTIISDEDYNNSKDIKALSQYIVIGKSDSVSNKAEKTKTEQVNTEKVFVSEGRYYTNPDDVFVRMNEPEDNTEEKITEVEEKIEDTVINNEAEVINNEEAVATVESEASIKEDTLKEEQKIVEVTSITENVDKDSKGTKSKNKSKTK